ncbi:hypothetical protein LTSEMON_2243, partial [Salmonella enterica subsp. enterica serovar Montevideo str. S5-403]
MSTDSPKLKKKVISGGIHRRVRIKWKSDGSRGIPVSRSYRQSPVAALPLRFSPLRL